MALCEYENRETNGRDVLETAWGEKSDYLAALAHDSTRAASMRNIADIVRAKRSRFIPLDEPAPRPTVVFIDHHVSNR